MALKQGNFKFNWKEVFTDKEGRTSSSSFVGVVTSAVCLLMMIILILFYFLHIAEGTIVLLFIDKLEVFFTIAATLMGVKSITNAIGDNVFRANNGKTDDKTNITIDHKSSGNSGECNDNQQKFNINISEG